MLSLVMKIIVFRLQCIFHDDTLWIVRPKARREVHVVSGVFGIEGLITREVLRGA